ncbi:MAG: exodeoxyribonuclease V subunit gamma [Chlamydiota bacterium]
MYKFFFSNDLEILAKTLYKNIQRSSLLRKTYILLPTKNSPWKDWLIHLWLQESQAEVVTCLEWMTLKEFFLLFSSKEIPLMKELTEDELFFLFHDLFAQLPKEPLLKPVKNYLSKASLGDTHTFRKTLAKLFSLYGLYGEKDHKRWQKNADWQDYLWGEIFRQQGHLAPFEIRFDERSLSEKQASWLAHADVHLFGFPFLPALYLERLHQIGKSASLHQYHFSASPFYWQDMLSDHSLARKSLQTPTASGLWEDRHRILANHGALEKEFFSLFDAYDFETVDCYREEFPGTALGHLQRSLFEAEEPRYPLEKDRSFQVFGAFGSKLREVEALLEQIFAWKQEHPTILLEDIAIFALDMGSYAPSIDLVFGQSGLAYHLAERPALSTSLSLHAFLRYVALLEGPFRKEEVLDFFALPPVYRHFHLLDEEIQELLHLLERTDLFFGVDEAHAKAHTHGQNSACFQKHHWEHLIQRIFLSLMSEPPQKGSLLWGEELPPLLPEVSWQDQKRIEPFLRCFFSLRDDHKLIETKGAKSLSFWCDFLEEKRSIYFSPEKEDFGMQEVESLLQETKKIVCKNPVSFAEVALFLRDRLEKKSVSSQTPKMGAISFRNLREASITPKKIMGFLGASDDVFPRYEKKHPLDKMESYVPLQGDLDRYLFLQALLSAKEKVYFSYQKRALADGKENSLSSLLTTLFSWMEERFGIEKSTWLTDIPIDPTSAALFQKTAPYRSYSALHFEMALKKSVRKKASPVFWTLPKQIPATIPKTVLVRDLERFAKHPLKFFIQKKLGIYLEEEPSEEIGFSLAPLEQFLYKKALLGKSPQELFQEERANPRFPCGIFASNAYSFLEKEKESLQGSLEEAGIAVEDLTSYPIKIKSLCGKEPIEVQGTLDNLHGEGLWTLQAKKPFSLIEHWPRVLLYLLSKEQKSCSLLFLRQGKARKISLHVPDPQKALSAYLHYFFLCLDTPSPLFPFWAKELLGEKSAPFLAKSRTLKEEQDLYLRWGLSERLFPSFEELFSAWNPFLRSVFSSLIEEGYR